MKRFIKFLSTWYDPIHILTISQPRIYEGCIELRITLMFRTDDIKLYIYGHDLPNFQKNAPSMTINGKINKEYEEALESYFITELFNPFKEAVEEAKKTYL